MRPSLPADGSGKPRSPASGRGVPPSPDASGPTPPASDPPVERTPAAPLATPTRETEVPPPAADPPVARTPAPAATPTRETETPSPAEAERNPLNRSDATSIQRRLRDLGYYVGDGNGVWGAASRNALRDFKSMNGLQEDDKWDRETEERLLSEQGVHAASTFIGDWGLDARDCRPRDGSAQLISISSRGAETAGGKCDFRSIKQEAAGRWRIRAACSAGGSSWSANISLRLSGPNLRWSSERGTETYIRCPRP